MGVVTHPYLKGIYNKRKVVENGGHVVTHPYLKGIYNRYAFNRKYYKILYLLNIFTTIYNIWSYQIL